MTTSHFKDTSSCPKKYLKLRAYLIRKNAKRTLTLSHLKFGLRRSFPELTTLHSEKPQLFVNSLFHFLDITVPKCITCQEAETNFNSKIGTFNRFCSTACSARHPETRLKTKASCLVTYGVDNPNKNADVRKKAEKTSLLRYGTSSPTQNVKVRRKTEATCLLRYGKCNPLQNSTIKSRAITTNLSVYGYKNPMQAKSVRNKARLTWRKNHGVDHPTQTQSVLNKMKATLQKNFGVDNPMQHLDIRNRSHRSAFKLKEFISASGRIHEYQGYENHILAFLDAHFNVKSYRTASSGDVPSFEYSDGHLYTPDVAVKLRDGRRLLIEVKSSWTLCGRDWERNLLKFEAVETSLLTESNTFFWLALTDSKGNIEWTLNPFANRCKLKSED